MTESGVQIAFLFHDEDEDHANYDSAEDDDFDFNPHKNRVFAEIGKVITGKRSIKSGISLNMTEKEERERERERESICSYERKTCYGLTGSKLSKPTI
ncbi:hypothetical protein Dsin_031941 [Dipteronia sinensis]|uniref:Uncharacterized protein n=1 Tax=Dipteronia sinensis TaxID=43782 RepID=A0AAE0DTU7_9ROSI|nr:hypothetical protein Dsin_031941 [Dipteronia sinensis]